VGLQRFAGARMAHVAATTAVHQHVLPPPATSAAFAGAGGARPRPSTLPAAIQPRALTMASLTALDNAGAGQDEPPSPPAAAPPPAAAAAPAEEPGTAEQLFALLSSDSGGFHAPEVLKVPAGIIRYVPPQRTRKKNVNKRTRTTDDYNHSAHSENTTHKCDMSEYTVNNP
jgi:hypothetical protein